MVAVLGEADDLHSRAGGKSAKVRLRGYIQRSFIMH